MADFKEQAKKNGTLCYIIFNKCLKKATNLMLNHTWKRKDWTWC